ncbi:MAG TPA: DUF4397 domain-containing protein, partial [Candidatus Limnocylindrales bacterium]|nr:DUF4397 domain-containing protein [Candidatus Limnocylindrales bacterium]
MSANRLQSRLWLLAVLAITALLFALPLSAQADESASVRFLHALPGAGPVDVYVDGQLTLVNLEFGAPSLFVQIPAGAHTVTVTQTGVTTALWQQEITPAAGTSLTMVVSTTDPLEFTVFQNDVTPLPEGKARITGIHAIAGGPVVDVVLADGRAVIPGLQYNTPYGTLDVPTGVYELAVVPQGGTVDAALIPVTPINLNSGTSYQIVAYGTASLPNILVLSAPAAGDASSAGLRVVHGVAGGPAVDLYLNDILIAPSLEFGGSTVFMQLPAGEYDAVLVPAGDPSGAPVASATLTLQAGADVTALAVADPEGVAFQVIPVSDINASAENAVVQVVNLSTANATAVLSGGASVVEATAGQTGDVSLPATSDNLVVSATGADLATIAGPFYGGAEYTVVVVDSGDGPMAFVLPPVSVATSIGSAPGNQTVSLAGEQPTEAPVAPTEAPAPTAAVVEAQPTLAPEVLPTAAPAGGLPTARVLTDPGVNVHLRQFPSSQALSLSLIGSGTNVDVLGREGAPATRPDATATPEGTPEPTPFVDPATLLESPGDDLDPTTTWLFISSVA